MAHCVNIKHPDVIKLAEQMQEAATVVAAKVAIWQEFNGLDKWPTINDLGLKSNIKPGVSELSDSNFVNSVYKALGFNVINESEITWTDEEGKPCAKMGGRSDKFTKGGKWEIIKEFKGASHERGGIDISINNSKISMTNKQGKIEAKYGLVINSKTLK